MSTDTTPLNIMSNKVGINTAPSKEPSDAFMVFLNRDFNGMKLKDLIAKYKTNFVLILPWDWAQDTSMYPTQIHPITHLFSSPTSLANMRATR